MRLLAEPGSDAGPRPLGTDDSAGLLVEDLGTGPALPRLAAWFGVTIRVVRDRWPGLPPAQAVYPAYRPWS